MKKISLALLKCLIVFIVFLIFLGIKYIRIKNASEILDLSQPKVSIVMPTYNRASFLMLRTLDSVVNQTYKNYEFIIINDGSTDLTSYILDFYMRADSRIKVIDNEKNLGVIASANKGLDYATGKYIARIDDDDPAYINRLEEQVKFMEENQNVDVSATLVSELNNDEAVDCWGNDFSEEGIKKRIYEGIAPFSNSSVMIKRDFLEKNNIRYNPEWRYLEDVIFFYDIAEAGGNFAIIPKVLMRYRFHRSNPIEYYQEQAENSIKWRKMLEERYK